jgi:hypothetical protein
MKYSRPDVRNLPPPGRRPIGSGDDSHRAFFGGLFYRSWSDNFKSTGDDPDAPHMDIYTAAVSVRTVRYFATGADTGGGSLVNVYKADTGAVVTSFNGLSPTFTGDVRVGVESVFGRSGRAAILTAAGPGGQPEVNPFDAGTLTSLGAFFAYPSSFTGGVFLG